MKSTQIFLGCLFLTFVAIAGFQNKITKSYQKSMQELAETEAINTKLDSIIEMANQKKDFVEILKAEVKNQNREVLDQHQGVKQLHECVKIGNDALERTNDARQAYLAEDYKNWRIYQAEADRLWKAERACTTSLKKSKPN